MRYKMKTLEQLGISPAPWSVTPNNLWSDDVTANDSTVVVAYEPPFEEAKDSINKRLISAAPELYQALRMYQDAFAEIRKSAWFLDANFHEIMKLNKVMTAADAALDKAAGESEVRK